VYQEHNEKKAMNRIRWGSSAALLLLALGGTAQAAPHAANHTGVPVAAWLQGWPMAGHDPQRTSRSPAVGPLHPRLLLTRPAAGGIAPVIDSAGNIYAWSARALLATTVTGQQRWQFHIGPDSPPALAPNGMIVARGFINGMMGLERSREFGLRSNGTLAWQKPHLGFAKLVAPLVTPANVAYLPAVGPTETNARLDRVTPSGKLRVIQPGFSFGAVAISPGGSLYALGRYSSSEDTISLERLTASGKVAWRHSLISQVSGLLVGRNGTIYVGGSTDELAKSGVLIAYSPAGKQRWRLSLSGGMPSLAERAGGTLLAATEQELSAVDEQGHVLWHTALSGSTAPLEPSLAVDGHGTGYIGTADGLVRIIDPGGHVIGRLSAGPGRPYETPISVLGPEGKLIVLGTDNRLRVYGSG
jgi:hypothetical protein